MKQKFNNYFFLAFFISLSLIACNNNDKKAEGTEATDNAGTPPAENTTTAAAEEKIDAAIAAPNLYKVVTDTLGIRVLEATYKPGDSSVMHSHPVNAMYVIQGGMGEFSLKDGTKMSLELKTGMSAVRGYDLHSVKNTGKTALKVLLVEVNRPANITAPDAATDATKVAADNYTTLHDSLGIRIVEVNYKPGQTSAYHTHPDYVAYVVEGGTGELTDKDGKKNINDIKAGTSWLTAAHGHSGKNIGKKPFKLILFEVSRGRN